MGYDTTGDGRVDALDTNGDGRTDARIVRGAAAAGGAAPAHAHAHEGGAAAAGRDEGGQGSVEQVRGAELGIF